MNKNKQGTHANKQQTSKKYGEKVSLNIENKTESEGENIKRVYCIVSKQKTKTKNGDQFDQSKAFKANAFSFYCFYCKHNKFYYFQI